MNDIEFDSELLRSLAKRQYFIFCQSNGFYCPYNMSARENAVIDLEFTNEPGLYKKYMNKASAIAMRKWRLKLRIDYMINNFKCMFVTFTINDDNIYKDVQVIRQYITKRVLNGLNCYFVGNVDYGSENERLHFHFVIASDDKEYIKSNYKWGFTDVRVITSKNAYRLSNYIDKLTLHAIKQETKNRYSIISSRGDFAFTDILKNYRVSEKKILYKYFSENCRNDESEIIV